LRTDDVIPRGSTLDERPTTQREHFLASRAGLAPVRSLRHAVAELLGGKKPAVAQPWEVRAHLGKHGHEQPHGGMPAGLGQRSTRQALHLGQLQISHERRVLADYAADGDPDTVVVLVGDDEEEWAGPTALAELPESPHVVGLRAAPAGGQRDLERMVTLAKE
jgi:hypothetical protein